MLRAPAPQCWVSGDPQEKVRLPALHWHTLHVCTHLSSKTYVHGNVQEASLGWNVSLSPDSIKDLAVEICRNSLTHEEIKYQRS